MPPSTHTMIFPGAITSRGFWLYVWKIQSPAGQLLYVGRTGDSSSTKASSPFTRIGLHLSTNDNQNTIRKHLAKREVQPENCLSFEMIAHGPMFPESTDRSTHVKRRDKVAALEKALADTLGDLGYDVMNEVTSRKPLDHGLWNEVRAAFAIHFPKLAETYDL